MARRTAGAIVTIVGITLVAYTLSIHFMGATSAWERLSKDFRPYFTQQAAAQAKTDAQGLQSVGQEFATKGEQVLGQALGQTPAQVAQTFAAQFPNTARALLALPAISQRMSQNAAVLENERNLFVRVDHTPSASQSSTQIPWFILIVGVLAIAFGVTMVFTLRVASILAVVLGLVMIAVPLAYSLPSKSLDANRLNDHLRPVFTQTNITQTQQDLQVLSGMANELQTKLVPTLSAALHVTPQQVQGFIGQNFPVLAGALPQLGAGLTRAATLAALQQKDLADFNSVQAVNYVPEAWLTIGGGILALWMGAWALAAINTSEEISWAQRRANRRAHKAA